MHETYEERRFCVGAGEWERTPSACAASARSPRGGGTCSAVPRADRARGERGHRAHGLAGRGGARVGRGGALARVPGRARVARGAAGRDAAARSADAAAWRTGVYAFRSFRRRAADAAEFVDLSARAWPGVRVELRRADLGLWRSLDVRRARRALPPADALREPGDLGGVARGRGPARVRAPRTS